MLKNILNLNGAQELNKNEQKSISGGGSGNRNLCIDQCSTTWICPSGSFCAWFYCNGNPSQPYATCVSSGGGGNPKK